ncbi:MAG: DNA-processing protein DprA [Lentisphaeria bacterium]
MENREAWLVLNALPGIGPVRVAGLLSRFGEPRHILAASLGELGGVPGIGAQLAGILHHWRDHFDLEAELALARRGQVAVVTRDDPDYPPLLKTIYDPPLCLYVRGDPAALAGPQSVAIVGSRHTTPYGQLMADHLAAEAVLGGWTVVSGLARGIDTVAHAAAVRLQGRTVAVLGSGLARVYPQENLELARQIVAAGGAMVSEFTLRAPPDKRGFPMRNRLISGMTLGTVVVEAGTRSGSLITAAQALDQGRPVFAVPGRVDSPQSRGCHGLLRDGAVLTESFADVLVELRTLPGFREPARIAPSPPAAGPVPGLPGKEKRAEDLTNGSLETKILDFVRRSGDCVLDEVVAALGSAAADVLPAVLDLELRRLVVRSPGGRLRAA